ncbi:MAG: phenylalanine--tRNA ligase subunit alpha [Deltaproteobacteria bacterium]|nr:phenylalanine--tRNA ligase subunit alpha [Deltaproteobacteria bacterium]
MNPEEIARTLHPLEIRVLQALGEQTRLDDASFEAEGIDAARLRTVIEWQLAKGCMRQVLSREKHFVSLTELGLSYVDGTPELRLIRRLREGALPVAELMRTEGLDPKEAGTALGSLKKAGVVQAGAEKELRLADDADKEPFVALGRLIRRVADEQRLDMDSLDPADAARVEAGSRKRGKAKGVFRIDIQTTRTLELTELGQQVKQAALRSGRSGDEINQLTPAMLADGSWRGKTFRPYNLAIRPSRVAGRRHPYREFLDYVRRKLCSLGFAEMRGELVESEFWNMDALFMPQFHSARQIHDVYFVKDPAKADQLDEPFASRVAAVHTDGGETGSRGWGYAFDRERSRRLVLRSQGTVLSARWLHQAEVPGKYFAIARCFRYDQVDATHAPDFYQCEGIVLGESIDFVTLLGLLKLFAQEVAKAEEIHFAPAYFPFTEPSVEIHMKHPRLGWTELGGAGIFRPEVTWPQGVEVPVIAWGLGLDRMAMVAMGIDDIRDLFSPDLGKVRATRIRMKD